MKCTNLVLVQVQHFLRGKAGVAQVTDKLSLTAILVEDVPLVASTLSSVFHEAIASGVHTTAVLALEVVGPCLQVTVTVHVILQRLP
jgi:hypothetical protein